MAELTNKPTARSCVINAAGTVTLGDADSKLVSAFLVDLESSSFVGSVTVKGRSREPSATGNTFKAGVYHADHLNGSASDGALHSDAITGASVILIPASGKSVQLHCTSYTSGTLTATWTPVTA